jgi:predicted ATP-grasp superfamily ATP-dependent carboligase
VAVSTAPVGLGPATAAFDRAVPALVMRVDPNVFHHGTLGVIRSLGRVGVEMHALIEGPASPSARSRYLHRVHPWSWPTGTPPTPAQVLAELAAVGERIGRRAVLVPVDDVGALLVAEHAAALSDRFLLPAQDPALPGRVADKAELATLCATVGVPYPDVRLPRSPDDLTDAVRFLGLPLMAKWSRPWRLPAGGGLRSTRVIRSAVELAVLLADSPAAGSQLVLQRLIPPLPTGDWFFQAYLDGEGRLLAGGTGRKERMHPADAGATTLGRWVPNAAVQEQALRLAAATGYRGLLDMDFRYDRGTGEYLLVDFNPRLGAQFRLLVDEQGLDLVRALHLDLTRREVPRWRPRPGRSFQVEGYDAVSAAHAWRAGELSIAGWRRSLRGVDERAWFTRDDPAPFAAMGRAAVALRLRRWRSGRAGRRR